MKKEDCSIDNEIINKAKDIILENPLKSVFFQKIKQKKKII